MRPLHCLIPALLSAAAAAADPDGSFLTALPHAPLVAAERARIQAAERSAGLAALLPDPELGLEAGRTWGPDDERMDMIGAMVEQPLPRWGERDARRTAARAAVAAARAEAEAVLGSHAAEIAALLAEHRAASAAAAVVAAQRNRLETVAALLAARAGTGDGLDGRLMVAGRIQALAVEAADLERRMADADSEVRGRLGLAPAAPLPVATWPDPESVRPERSPMARRAAAMVAEADAMAQESTARGLPETAVGVGWERDGVGSAMRSDQVTLRLTVSLPVWRDAYADGIAAADARRRAAAHEAHGAERMARTAVAMALRAATQAALAEAAATTEETRLQAQGDAIVRRIAAAGADAAAWLDLFDRTAEVRKMAIAAALMRDRALADLWRYAPPTLPEP